MLTICQETECSDHINVSVLQGVCGRGGFWTKFRSEIQHFLFKVKVSEGGKSCETLTLNPKNTDVSTEITLSDLFPEITHKVREKKSTYPNLRQT